jgi:hypothetical protein
MRNPYTWQYHGTWSHLNGVLLKSLPSVCVCICIPPFVARQRLGKQYPAATNTRNIRRIVGRVVLHAIHVVFKESMRFVLPRISCYFYVRNISIPLMWGHQSTLFWNLYGYGPITETSGVLYRIFPKRRKKKQGMCMFILFVSAVANFHEDWFRHLIVVGVGYSGTMIAKPTHTLTFVFPK